MSKDESAAEVFLREYAPQALSTQDALREGKRLADGVRRDQALERKAKERRPRAVAEFEKGYEGTEVDFQRVPDDRGEAPLGRLDPSKVVNFRCASCEAHNRLNERDLAAHGYVRDEE